MHQQTDNLANILTQPVTLYRSPSLEAFATKPTLALTAVYKPVQKNIAISSPSLCPFTCQERCEATPLLTLVLITLSLTSVMYLLSWINRRFHWALLEGGWLSGRADAVAAVTSCGAKSRSALGKHLSDTTHPHLGNTLGGDFFTFSLYYLLPNVTF